MNPTMKNPHSSNGGCPPPTQPAASQNTPLGGTVFPIGSEITFATVNANGALTAQTDGSAQTPRLQLLFKFFKEIDLQVFAVQEPHISSSTTNLQEAQAQIHHLSEQAGFDYLMPVAPPGARGGVSLFWKRGWTQTHSLTLSSRLLLANLSRPDGLVITFVAAHFSDKPTLRQQQWEELQRNTDTFPFSPHVILWADHNSVIIPGVDSEFITVHDNLPPAQRARTAELNCLTELRMQDAWDIVHKSSNQTDDHRRAKGWTWGFHTEQRDGEPNATPHRRRIDKVHVSQHMCNALTRCYTRKATSNDHKAVIATISPADTHSLTPRKRIPLSFLRDEHTTHTLAHRLQALPGQGEE